MLCTMSAAPAAKTMARREHDAMIDRIPDGCDDAVLLVSPWSSLDFGIFGCTGPYFSLYWVCGA